MVKFPKGMVFLLFSIDKFADMSISSSDSDDKSIKSDSSHKLDSD